MEIGYCLDGSSHKQSPAVLVITESVTGHVPKNLSVGRTLKEHVAADQQPTRMGIETNREIAGTETSLSVPSRVGESGCWLCPTHHRNCGSTLRLMDALTRRSQ